MADKGLDAPRLESFVAEWNPAPVESVEVISVRQHSPGSGDFER